MPANFSIRRRPWAALPGLRISHAIIARSEIPRSAGKQSHRWDRHLAGHSSPRTPIRGPVWIPGGTSRETRDRPTEEGIASGLRPRNYNSARAYLSARNRIVTARVGCGEPCVSRGNRIARERLAGCGSLRSPHPAGLVGQRGRATDGKKKES